MKINTHRDLEVYRLAFEAAMRVFEVSKGFPKEEHYSLVDQIRRSSRSVCANIAEAWRKRRYAAAFISKGSWKFRFSATAAPPHFAVKFFHYLRLGVKTPCHPFFGFLPLLLQFFVGRIGPALAFYGFLNFGRQVFKAPFGHLQHLQPKSIAHPVSPANLSKRIASANL